MAQVHGVVYGEADDNGRGDGLARAELPLKEGGDKPEERAYDGGDGADG